MSAQRGFVLTLTAADGTQINSTPFDLEHLSARNWEQRITFRGTLPGRATYPITVDATILVITPEKDADDPNLTGVRP